MNISQIYSRFAIDTDRLYRQSMLLAARHRVVRCHHVLRAGRGVAEEFGKRSGDRDGSGRGEATAWSEVLGPALAGWQPQLDAAVEQDPIGSLDAPLANSPAMRRVLQLCLDRTVGGMILPSGLIATVLTCWSEELPPGPSNESYRRQVGQLLSRLSMKLPPAFDFADSGLSVSKETTGPPTTEELEELIGPALSPDDLIDMYQTMKNTQNPALKAALAWKLEYLRRLG